MHIIYTIILLHITKWQLKSLIGPMFCLDISLFWSLVRGGSRLGISGASWLVSFSNVSPLLFIKYYMLLLNAFTFLLRIVIFCIIIKCVNMYIFAIVYRTKSSHTMYGHLSCVVINLVTSWIRDLNLACDVGQWYQQ